MNDYSENPLVSVIMPTYNVENYVVEAINSILKQSYQNFEFFIIDDGSTDHTPEILKSFVDSRIKLIFNEKNEGNPAARNKGCRLATGKYIAAMDADDVAYPERFEIQVKFLEDNLDVLALGTSYRMMGENVEVILPTEWEKVKYILMKTFCMLHPTIMIRRKDMEDVGFYYTNSRFAEDYNLLLRLAKRGKVTNLSNVLLIRRLHEKQISSVHKKEQHEFSRKVQLRYQHELNIYYPPLHEKVFLNELILYVYSILPVVQSKGLFYGQMGIVLFFFHYAKYENNAQYGDWADTILNNLLNTIDGKLGISLDEGLSGIGLALGYLLHLGFVTGDPDDILKDFDLVITNHVDLNMEDWSLETGLLGIFCYIYYRLLSSHKTECFDNLYIGELKQVVNKMLNHKSWKCPNSTFLLDFLRCLNGEKTLINWSGFLCQFIYSFPIEPAIGEWPIGLRMGCAGWGIVKILNLDIYERLYIR